MDATNKDAIVGQLDRYGYAVVENVLSMGGIASCLENLTRLYTRFTGESVEYTENTPWLSKAFHEQMAEFRKRDPRKFGAMYDSAQSSVVLTQLMSDPLVVDIVATSLGVNPSDLSRQGFEYRMDAPFDTRNSLGWHQDQSYFLGNVDGLRGLVVWAPLSDIEPSLGPLDILPGSHSEGFVGPAASKWRPKTDSDGSIKDAPGTGEVTNNDMSDDEYITSEQLPVDDNLISKYEVVSVTPLKRGDIVLFNNLMVHRSGENTSDQFRLSAQCRFHVSTESDFIPFLTMPKPNRFVEETLRNALG